MDAEYTSLVVPPNRRERRFVLFASALIVLFAVLLIAAIWYLFPQGFYQYVAPIEYYPPSDQPYFVAFNDEHLIIINTGDELRVFDGHSTRPGCEGGLVYWRDSLQGHPVAGGLKEPCHGAAYNLDGSSNLRDGPPARGLDAYQYEIRDGDLYVCFNCLIPGDPPP